ncbi:unnamed protein product [Lota lota]
MLGVLETSAWSLGNTETLLETLKPGGGFQRLDIPSYINLLLEVQRKCVSRWNLREKPAAHRGDVWASRFRRGVNPYWLSAWQETGRTGIGGVSLSARAEVTADTRNVGSLRAQMDEVDKAVPGEGRGQGRAEGRGGPRAGEGRGPRPGEHCNDIKQAESHHSFLWSLRCGMGRACGIIRGGLPEWNLFYPIANPPREPRPLCSAFICTRNPASQAELAPSSVLALPIILNNIWSCGEVRDAAFCRASQKAFWKLTGPCTTRFGGLGGAGFSGARDQTACPGSQLTEQQMKCGRGPSQTSFVNG